MLIYSSLMMVTGANQDTSINRIISVTSESRYTYPVARWAIASSVVNQVQWLENKTVEILKSKVLSFLKHCVMKYSDRPT